MSTLFIRLYVAYSQSQMRQLINKHTTAMMVIVPLLKFNSNHLTITLHL